MFSFLKARHSYAHFKYCLVYSQIISVYVERYIDITALPKKLANKRFL